MPPDSAAVLLDIRDGIAVCTLNRADVRNAMSPEMLAEIDAVCAELIDCADVRSLVFVGSGSSFSGGGDLARMAEWDTDTAARVMAMSHEMRRHVEAFPKPTIAAVHGYALGGGLELAMCCDVIIMTESARVGLPEAKVGMIPSSGGCTRLPYLVGHLYAKSMIMTGRSIDAQEALRVGLATAVVPEADLERAYLDYAAQFAGCSPTALTGIKSIVNRSRGIPFADAQLHELDVALQNFASADRREGNRAFLDRRAPVWPGTS